MTQEASIEGQLRALLSAGLSPDEATEKVLAPYGPSPLVRFSWPAVRRCAYGLARDLVREVEDAALGAGARLARANAALRLPVATFRLGDGTEVEWGKATVAQHNARIAWQRGQVAAIETDIARHERAVALIRQRGVECLDDIEGWVDLLADGSVANPPVERVERSRVRKPTTRRNGRRGDAGKD